jgi:hypothetical protein
VMSSVGSCRRPTGMHICSFHSVDESESERRLLLALNNVRCELCYDATTSSTVTDGPRLLADVIVPIENSKRHVVSLGFNFSFSFALCFLNDYTHFPPAARENYVDGYVVCSEHGSYRFPACFRPCLMSMLLGLYTLSPRPSPDKHIDRVC